MTRAKHSETCLAIGQGSDNIAVGDEVYMLGDSWTPFALRAEENGFFTLHGETYLDSVFQGSSMNSQIRGTDIPFPRGVIVGLDAILAGSKKKEYAISPFLKLYEGNAQLIERVKLI